MHMTVDLTQVGIESLSSLVLSNTYTDVLPSEEEEVDQHTKVKVTICNILNALYEYLLTDVYPPRLVRYDDGVYVTVLGAHSTKNKFLSSLHALKILTRMMPLNNKTDDLIKLTELNNMPYDTKTGTFLKRIINAYELYNDRNIDVATINAILAVYGKVDGDYESTVNNDRVRCGATDKCFVHPKVDKDTPALWRLILGQMHTKQIQAADVLQVLKSYAPTPANPMSRHISVLNYLHIALDAHDPRYTNIFSLIRDTNDKHKYDLVDYKYFCILLDVISEGESRKRLEEINEDIKANCIVPKDNTYATVAIEAKAAKEEELEEEETPEENTEEGDVEDTEDNNSIAPPTRAYASSDNQDGLISLDVSNEGINEHLYRRALYTVCTKLVNGGKHQLTSEQLSYLTEWCRRWLFIASIKESKKLAAHLGLAQAIKQTILFSEKD